MSVKSQDEELTRLVRSLHGFLSWSTSATTMDAAMEASGFPLVGDQAAFVLLHHVAHLGPVRPTDVADVMKTGRSNVSKIARRLEDAHLVVRRVDPRDERQVRLHLTETGQRIGERVVALTVEHLADALADWPATDIRELRRLLSALAHSLAEATPGARQPDSDGPTGSPANTPTEG